MPFELLGEAVFGGTTNVHPLSLSVKPTKKKAVAKLVLENADPMKGATHRTKEDMALLIGHARRICPVIYRISLLQER
jgi:hypothetical protein